MAKLYKIISKHLRHFLKVALLETADPSCLFLTHRGFFSSVPFLSDNNLSVSQSSTFSHAETRWNEKPAECIGKGVENWRTESVRDAKET